MEKLDINNVIEAQEIRNLIRHKKSLIDFYDELIKKINIQINNEKPIFKIQYNTLEYSTTSSEEEADSPSNPSVSQSQSPSHPGGSLNL